MKNNFLSYCLHKIRMIFSRNVEKDEQIKEKEETVLEQPIQSEIRPFVSFQCEECKSQITVYDVIGPGEVCVIKCDSCGESWSVYSKSLEIIKTSQFEIVWPYIESDIKSES